MNEARNSRANRSFWRRRTFFSDGIRRSGKRLLLLAVIGGCAAPLHAVMVELGADFAAHTERQGLVVDRMQGGAAPFASNPAMLEQNAQTRQGGGPAMLVPHAGWFTNNPFVLEQNGQTIAALWVKDNAHVTVRQVPDRTAPVTGRIEATRQDGAIKLNFNLADGSEYGTGRFHRVDVSTGPEFLGPDARTILDVRGMYRAEVRDAHGQPIGWFRVQINAPEGGYRVYDAELPPALDGPMAVAAAQLVNVDVDDLVSHAIDIYQGN